MEKLIYELRPYFYLGLAVYAIMQTGSHLAQTSGFLLLLSAGLIVRWRMISRQARH